MQDQLIGAQADMVNTQGVLNVMELYTIPTLALKT